MISFGQKKNIQQENRSSISKPRQIEDEKEIQKQQIDIRVVPINDMTVSDVTNWLQCLGFDEIASIVLKKEMNINEFQSCAKVKFAPIGCKLVGIKYSKFRKAYTNLQVHGYTRRQKFGQFDIIRPLGSGNFGTTYLVQKNDKLFALKHILTRKEQHATDAAKEIKALRLFTSPNIVKFITSFHTIEGIAIVMQYCDEGNLEDIIERGKIPEYYACKILIDIAKGLDVFHSNGVVHRDLKPDNIFLHKGNVVIGDLGLSRTLENGNYLSKIGYIYYTAPEIKKSGFFSTSSDIWSLGCIILTMLSSITMEDRKPPLFTLQQWEINEIIGSEVGQISSRFTNITKSCLAKNMEHRPHIKKILSMLKKIMNGTPVLHVEIPTSPCSFFDCYCQRFLMNSYIPLYCIECGHSNYEHEQNTDEQC